MIKSHSADYAIVNPLYEFSILLKQVYSDLQTLTFNFLALMELKDILLRKLDSILNPKFENRFIGTFLTLGVLLVGIPSVSAVFSIKRGETTFTAEINNGSDILMIILGVLSLAIALYLFERKRKREDIEKVSLVDEKDKRTVRSILESVNTHVIDNAIERGRLSQFYDPVTHYYYGIEGLVKSSSFKVYNKELDGLFERFYLSFNSFMSHGNHFRQTSNPDLHRFVKLHEIGDWKKHEDYENSYLSDVQAFSEAFRSLIEFVKHKYPDIDLEITNRAASDDYAKYYVTR